MIGMEYDKIIKYFKDNTALVSMNKIDEFFNRIPADDRMMVETFMRTELGLNVFDYITIIPEKMFAYNSDLKTIVIPSTIEDIERNAFEGCSASSIAIEAQIWELKEATFSNCKSLSEVSLPSTLTTIDKDAFRNCTSLKEITLPKNIEDIKSGAFRGCETTLEKMALPMEQVKKGLLKMNKSGVEGEFFRKVCRQSYMY